MPPHFDPLPGPTTPKHDVLVLGAGLTGLTAALLLARDGHRVTVVDRDGQPPPSAPCEAWSSWLRPGCAQFRQPHLMLPRWRQEMERELPDVLPRLIDAGGTGINLLHQQPASTTRGRAVGDEHFDTVAARRPVLEAVLSQIVDLESQITVCRGTRAHGLLVRSGSSAPRVMGLRTSAGDLRAELVVDASGRRTRVPAWVRGLNGLQPHEHAERGGFVYYSRSFTARRGACPRGEGGLLTHYPALSALTLPGDGGTYSLVLVCTSRDRHLRALRHEDVWTAVASSLPPLRPWLIGGLPTSGVIPMAGLTDTSRSYVHERRPVVWGLVAIGEASHATNPSLGRGATLGLLESCALRDALRLARPTGVELTFRFDEMVTALVRPWVDLTRSFDRHRLAEMESDRAGLPYRPVDPSWEMTTRLLAGARQDPVLARASARVAGMLAPPNDVLADPDVGQRLSHYDAFRHYASNAPGRDALLAAAEVSTRRRRVGIST